MPLNPLRLDRREAVNPLRVDPTRTGLLQRKLGMELTRLLQRLYTEAANRVYQLAPQASASSPPQPIGNALFGDGGWLRSFAGWLADRAKSAIIGPAKALFARWLGMGVQRGAARAVADSAATPGKVPVPKQGIPVTVATALGTGGSKERVGLILERSLMELEGLTSAEVQGIVRILADGMQAGMNPKQVAKLIRERFNLTKRRAETIARTEMIRAHAEGQLIGFEKMGVTTLGVQAEWLATKDKKTCPHCKAMSGKVFTIDEARGKIPAHPNCRCAWVPNIPTVFLEEPTREPNRTGRRGGLRGQRGSAASHQHPPRKPVTKPHAPAR